MSYTNPLLEKAAATVNTVDDINKALDQHYAMLGKFLTGVGNDKWHLIVNGPAGSGKTEYTKKILSNNHASIISGTLSAIKLYIALYQNRRKGQVLIIDDTDKTLEDTECLEVLKAALDSQGNKSVDWNKYSTALAQYGVPDSFVFKGRVVIITNKHMSGGAKQTKAQVAIAPVLSRCQYFKAGLPSKEWEVAALRRMVETGEVRCFNEAGISVDVQNQIVDFVEEHADDLREISFRVLKKCLDLYLEDNTDWQFMALASMGV